MRERDVLRLVQERFGSASPGVTIGPGDDAAVLEDGTVITTDAVVDDVHVDRRWSSLADVGWKAVHAAVSDIPAMGARATAAVVSAQLPGELDDGHVAELLDGFAEGAVAADVPIVGGDVTSSPTLTVTVTVIGRLVGAQPCTRAGASPGDIVGVIGHVGRAAAGLALHRAAKNGGELDVLAAHPELSAAHRRPRALVAAAEILADPHVTAGIDVSDGLGRDLGHIAAASGVQIRIESLPHDQLVAAAADVLDVHVLDVMLGGGDDHALAVTIDPAAVSRVGDAVGTLGLPFAVIGTVGRGTGVQHGGEDVSQLGWEHR